MNCSRFQVVRLYLRLYLLLWLAVVEELAALARALRATGRTR